MLEVTHGYTRRQDAAARLTDALKQLSLDGSLYIGYPMLATSDEPLAVDALLVSREHGLTLFSLLQDPPPTTDEPSWLNVKSALDKLFVAAENSLLRHESLRQGRRLGVEIHTVGIFPVLDPHTRRDADGAIFTDLEGLPAVMEGFAALDDAYYRPLQAVIQGVSTMKPRKKRQNATTAQSRGSILREIEREIANLDQWQKRAAIESPDAPQRIRGLAGSGKTIVLALKAAYLHTKQPDWKIAVTFQSRSLYQQFEELIRKFTFETTNDDPNWDNLRILHAWGGRDRDGVYTEIARHSKFSPQDFLYASNRYGRDQAFQGVCNELLAATSEDHEPLYDAVLIDEAQDLPPAFFRLVYRFTRDPKRIVWAYDDLQRLSETSMPTLEELFGTNEQGDPLVSLVNSPGSPLQDIVLRICYRNPPWIIAVAHALGLGIYRAAGLVQHFDEPSLWTDVGYNVRAGDLEPGHQVVLKRAPDSYPPYFPELLKPEDAVVHKRFSDALEQAAWVAARIRDDLDSGELDRDDILVVLPDAYTARREASAVTAALSRLGIGSHLVGVTSSRDEMFSPTSIALAHIHRSKGNEAAMVYVINAQQCVSRGRFVTLRNTLFTAITRSRAWVRICGVGPEMTTLQAEIDQVASNGWALKFNIPTREELSTIRQIHRELSDSERQRVRQVEQTLRNLVEAVEGGDLELSDLPLDLRASLAKYFARQPEEHDDTE